MSFFYSALKSSDSNMVVFVYPPIVMAQTRLECFGSFIVYMSTVSNVNITFGCTEFVSRKFCIYTCINIYGRTRYNS